MLFYGSLERPAFRRSPSGLDPLGLALAGDAGRRLPSTFILPDLIALRIALRRARARNYVDKADRCPDFCWLGGPYNGHLRGDDAYRLSGHREMRSIPGFGRPIGYLTPIALACLSTTLKRRTNRRSESSPRSRVLSYIPLLPTDRSILGSDTHACIHSWLYSQMPIKASPSCHPSRSVVRQRAHCCRLSRTIALPRHRSASIIVIRTRAWRTPILTFRKIRERFSRSHSRESEIRGDPLFA